VVAGELEDDRVDPGGGELGGAPADLGREIRRGRVELDVDHHAERLAGPAALGAALLDGLQGLDDPVEGEPGVQQDAVGQLAGQPEGLRAARPDDHRRRLGGRPVQLHAVELDVLAGGGDRAAVQQGAHGGGVLAQERHRRRRARPDLGHPLEHAVPEAGQEPAGEHPGQGGDLHRGQRGVAQRHRQQADADLQVLGPGQRGRGGGQAALGEAVLPQPQLVDAGVLGRAHDVSQVLGWGLGTEHHAQGWLAHSGS
jgi:hypothetical protein